MNIEITMYEKCTRNKAMIHEKVKDKMIPARERSHIPPVEKDKIIFPFGGSSQLVSSQ